MKDAIQVEPYVGMFFGLVMSEMNVDIKEKFDSNEILHSILFEIYLASRALADGQWSPACEYRNV